MIQGFNVLAEDKSRAFIENYDLASLTYFSAVTAEDFESSVTKLESTKNLDREVKSTARVEQNYLRNTLFPKAIGICCLCGNSFPIEFLIAAHIKKRAACTHEEKLDARNVVMSACKFGCDELFERGYIAVTENGIIVRATKALHTIHTTKYVDQLAGRQCLAFTKKNSHYFEWHRNFTFNT